MGDRAPNLAASVAALEWQVSDGLKADTGEEWANIREVSKYSKNCLGGRAKCKVYGRLE
jgi:hypothetical protein